VQLLLPLVQELLEKHQNLILVAQLLKIRLHTLQIFIGIGAARASLAQVVVATSTLAVLGGAVVWLLALPLANDPSLLALPELSDVAQEVVGLPLGHVAVHLEHASFENVLQAVQPGIVVLPEERDRLLQEA